MVNCLHCRPIPSNLKASGKSVRLRYLLPLEVENVTEGYCYYDVYYDDKFLRRITMLAKHYKRMRRFIDDLHLELLDQVPLASQELLLTQFDYDDGKSE